MDAYTPDTGGDGQTTGKCEVYAEHMTPEDRATFMAVSNGVDLEYEIRLLRLIVTRLAGDVLGNLKLLMPVITALFRAISLQSKQERSGSEVEQSLRDGAETVLEARSSAAGTEIHAKSREQGERHGIA